MELSHFISNCNFDLDFRWRNQNIWFENQLKIKTHSFETDLNFSNIKLIVGYSHLDFNCPETTASEFSSGVLIGFGTRFNLPLYPTAIMKVSLYKNKIQYHALVQGGYKRFLCFLKYDKLNSFNEFSIGIGSDIGYRLKRRVE